MDKRLFIAVNPPEEMKQKLSFEADAISSELPREAELRRTEEDKLHFTILFLDSQPEGLIGEIVAGIREAVKDFPAFEVRITKSDYNPGEKRMVWAYSDSEEMKELSAKIAAELMKRGIRVPNEGRNMIPHITFGRFSYEGNLPDIAGETNLSFQAKSVDLMESEWPDGEEHMVVETIDLIS